MDTLINPLQFYCGLLTNGPDICGLQIHNTKNVHNDASSSQYNKRFIGLYLRVCKYSAIIELICSQKYGQIHYAPA